MGGLANGTCPGLNAGYVDADGDGICDRMGWGSGAGWPAYNATTCPHFQNTAGNSRCRGMMGVHGWCHGRS